MNSRTTLSLVFVAICAFTPPVMAQSAQSPSGPSPERERGIRLYNQSKDKEAVSELRSAVKKDKDDGDAWYYLGLALIGVDDLKSARKAFESAVRLKPQFGPAHTGLAYTLIAAGKNDDQATREATTAIRLSKTDPMAHYLLGVVDLRESQHKEAMSEAETAIAQNPKYGPPYLLKSQALLALEGDESANSARTIRVRTDQSDQGLQERRERSKRSRDLFRAAKDSLQTYLTLVGSNTETEMWKKQLAALEIYAGAPEPTLNIVSGFDVTTKARVLGKPQPTYTEEARRAGIQGTVILRAVFTDKGTVEHVLVLRSLPGGLTERAIAAAKKISFVPATKNGQPVAMIMELQYNFYLS